MKGKGKRYRLRGEPENVLFDLTSYQLVAAPKACSKDFRSREGEFPQFRVPTFFQFCERAAN